MRKISKKVVIYLTNIFFIFIITGSLLFAQGGTDLMKEMVKDAFATFIGTGINVLLLIEIVTASYLFSTGDRKLKTWIGFPVLILVTSYAAVKFGSLS